MSILNVEHLSHGFGDRAIFTDVSFRLLKGEHIGLVGANGEGKSTFMNIITGSLMPDEGKIEWAKNVLNNYSGDETVNAGTGKELTIKELTELVAKVIGYEGEIKWDTTRPNGTPRKLLDVSKAAKLGWTYKTELEDGIRLAYEDFLNNPMRAER